MKNAIIGAIIGAALAGVVVMIYAYFRDAKSLFAKVRHRASSKSQAVGKLATDLDPERPYLSGLLLRFDEELSEAISFFRKLNPRFMPPPIPVGAPHSVRGGFAAHTLAISIASQAMSSQGKLIVGSKELSIGDGALGLSYALFIWIILAGYMKDDGVAIDSMPLANSFAELFVYLDHARRKELAKNGVEIFQDMIKHLPDHPKLQEWHGMLSKNIQIWLILTTSDKRTKEHDEDLRKVFSSQLGALYAAAEQTRKDAQE